MQNKNETEGHISDLQDHLARQRNFFQTGRTLDYNFRRNALERLYRVVNVMQEDIITALGEDLGKSEQEAYLTEIGIVLSSIRYARKKLRSWMKPRGIWPDITLFPAKSRIYPEPLGLVLILSPWNYPLLSLMPLIDALAAGNCCVVKPSPRAPVTSQIIASLLANTFDPGHVLALSGGDDLGEALLHQQFDFIFYTGSARVGRKVLEAAAPHLIPVCLELGGKSPVLVCKDANLKLAARRIAWGKTLNAGQTCVAPDYVLAHASVREKLVELLQRRFDDFPGPDALHNQNYGRIVSLQALERLEELAQGRAILSRETLRMQPLILTPEDGISLNSPVMREEIFGPILPVFDFQESSEAVNFIWQQRHKPLACYVFSASTSKARRLMDRLSFGGGCINDVVIHAGSHSLPFGGVGQSGMGRYHGKAGFELFSNMKTLVQGSTWFDPAWRYPPMGKGSFSLVRRLLR